jgi:hypothetical protein
VHLTYILFAAFKCIFIVTDSVSKNKPMINNESVLPGLLVGAIWAIAQISAFYASKNLDQVLWHMQCAFSSRNSVCLLFSSTASFLRAHCSSQLGRACFILGVSANILLTQVVAFPICSSGPGLVGAMWGIFVFGEIKGAKNFAVVAAAFATTIAGVVCIAQSKS